VNKQTGRERGRAGAKVAAAGKRTDKKPATLAAEIDGIRDHVGDLVGALDPRRHEALDFKSLARRHGGALFLAGAALVALAAGVTAVATVRARRRRSTMARLERLRSALSRIEEHPERVAAPQPGLSRKIVGAAGASVATVLARRLAERMLRPEV